MNAPLTLHVAPGGDDAHDASVERPVASLQRARDLARAARRTKPERPVRIELAGGTYALSEPLLLTPADSGTAAAPVRWTSAPGARARVSGGVRLTGWRIGEHRGLRAWTLHLPEVQAGRWYFQQLFVAGCRRPRTRLPKAPRLADGEWKLHADDPCYRFAHAADGSAPPAGSAGFAAGDLDPAWRNLADVRLVCLKYWVDLHFHLDGIDGLRRLARFVASGAANEWGAGKLVDEKGEGARYWVENVFEALDTPGQWYLDRASGVLTYLPRDGEDPLTTEIVAPRLDELVRFQGAIPDGGEKVRHVRFEGIDFAHSEFLLPRCNPGAGQSQFSLPGAIAFCGAEDCALYACSVSHVSQYAVEIAAGSHRVRVVACHLHDLGAGGVKVNHDGPHCRADTTGAGAFIGMSEPVVTRWHAPSRPLGYQQGCGAVISDNVIERCGRIYPSACGVWIGDSARNRVLRNRISDTYYTAISVGWTWGYRRTLTVDNRIEGNHLHDIGQAVLSDLGAVYLLGPQPGTVVRGNLIHDVAAYGYGDGGIYPDEGSSFMIIESNVVLSGGFGSHYGRDNLVRGNVFVAKGLPIGLGRGEPYRAFHATGNLVLAAGYDAVGGASERATFSGNLYWRLDGGAPRFPGGDFARWQAGGFDAESRIADPLIVGPLAAGLALRADSPARALGLALPGPGDVGPRFRGVLPASLDDVPADVGEADRPIVEVRLEFGTAAEFAASDVVDPDPQAANYYRFVDASQPTALTVVVTNRGSVPVSGQVDVVGIVPPGHGLQAVQIAGQQRVRYQLAPGERTAADLTARLDPSCPRALIEARVDGRGALPSAVHLTSRAELTLQLVTVDRLDGVIAALASCRPLSLPDLPPGSALRVAWTGQHLAIHARVRDPHPLRQGAPWAGSDIELFTAMPGTNGRIDRAPRRGNAQLFLQPAVGEQPAVVQSMVNHVHPEPTAAIASRAIADGYELWALIPAAVAKLDPGAKRFCFAAIVRTVPVDGVLRHECRLPHAPTGGDNGSWCMATVE